jgi:hypothetical protein
MSTLNAYVLVLHCCCAAGRRPVLPDAAAQGGHASAAAFAQHASASDVAGTPGPDVLKTAVVQRFFAEERFHLHEIGAIRPTS